MDLGLSGKVALVTGGSRGIGKAIARTLAAEGVDVTLSYASNEAAAIETVETIRAAGGRASAVRFDVGDAEGARAAVDALVAEKGALHILVNNAGVALDGLVLRYKDDDLERSFRTNVFGAFYLARAAARSMMKARFGRIVMLGSVVGEMGNTGQTVYASTKAALDGMAKSLARELASRNVTANVVAPGFIDTDMTRELPEQAKEAMLASIPAGRMGTAEEVADAVAFLASERARYVTGCVLHVNGGMYM
jgi:3-oxoacyl-[acyl-carrier protein] reductase